MTKLMINLILTLVIATFLIARIHCDDNASATKADDTVLFHLAWTTSSAYFDCWRLYVILSIQRNYRNQHYVINIHSNTLSNEVFSKCADYDKIFTQNIKIRPIGNEVFKDTPLFEWWSQHKEFHGDLPLKTDFRYSHLTDVVRFAVLWRYGGIYLDFDMLLLRPLTFFYNSFASQKDMSDKVTMDDSDPYNFAVAVFGAHHPFLKEVMQNVSYVYDPTLWPCVGPRLITSFVNDWNARGKAIFHSELPKAEMNRDQKLIHIFPHPFFYPLYWKFGSSLVQKTPTSRQDFNRLIYHAVTLHIWSRSTNISTIEKGSVLYILMNHLKDTNATLHGSHHHGRHILTV